MSTDLGYKQYNDFGMLTKGSNPLGSGKWVYAASKSGVDKSTTEKVFEYWQNSDYMKTARYAQGAAGQNRWVDPKDVKQTGPYGQTNGSRGGQLAKYMGKSDFDPFSLARAGMFNKRKDLYTGFSQQADGSASYWKTKQVKEYKSGPYGNNWSTTKPTGGGGQSSGPYGAQNNPATRSPQSRVRPLYGTRGEKVTGQMLNGAFVEQGVYDQMTDNQKAVYGLKVGQAQAKDELFGVASQVVDAAYQYRRGRSRKKTGLGSIVGALAPQLLTIAGTAFGGPVGGAIGSAVSTGIQGGGIKDIALDAGKAFVGGKIAGAGANKVGEAGSIWDAAGGGTNPLGAASTAGATNGAGNVSFINDLFKGGSDLFSNLGDGLGDIFKGGTGGLTDFLSGGGKAGQLGDLLNVATGGQSSGIGNILSGITGGNLGQILSGGGQLGLLDSLLGSGRGGATPGFAPTSGGGGAPAGGGGTYQTVGGQVPQQGGQAPQQGGQLGGLLGLLASGYLSQHSTGEVRDEIKSGRDRAIDLADPLADQRSTFAGQLGALMADPSQRVPELPGYQFRFDQGQKAMQRAADAGGLAGSGNALIAAAEYGQNFAQAAYDSEFQKLYDLSSGSNAAAQAASNAGTQLALLEHGKYSDYAGLINQATGGAIPNPGGNLVLPGQQQQQQSSGGMLEQIISSLLGSNSNPPSGNDAGSPYAPGGPGADNSGGGFGTNSSGISQFARLH